MKNLKINTKLNILIAISVLLTVLSVGNIIANFVLINREPTVTEVKPMVVYQVDSAANSITGNITDKQAVGNRYLLTINEQETYMVPKHVYDATKIGDNVPSYLNGK